MPEQTPGFTASGVVTLTSDFGLKDPFVGVMKGRLIARFPCVRIVDLTHEIPAHWPAEAGFWVARSFRYFPAGTVHVAVVDPGVGSARAIAAVEAEGHVFLAPDNGLLAPVLESAASVVARHVGAAVLARLGIDAPSATFHGRDVFAPLAAEIAAGRLQPSDLGPVTDDLVPGWLEEPVAGVLTVCDSALETCPAFPRPVPKLHVSFFDPAVAEGTDDEKMAVFRRVRDEIRDRLVPELRARR